MFVLQLNDMRSPKFEMTTAVARADTREALEQFVERERIASYSDGKWHKG